MKLMNKEGVTINRNDNFYMADGTINNKLFHEDKTHVFGEGVSKLAGNSRFALARALDIALVQAPRRSGGQARYKR